MRYRASQSLQDLLIRARTALTFTQKEMANAIGGSLRTVSRWESRQATPADFHLHKLAGLLYPQHADLAFDAALHGGTTLERLGIVKPPPPPPPPPAPLPAPLVVVAPPPPPPPPAPPPPPPQALVDAIVCAVARALEELEGAPVSLAKAHAAAAAAVLRARELRLDLDAAAEAFAPRASAQSAGPQAAASDAEGATPRARRARS